jgi:hypothetical protein
MADTDETEQDDFDLVVDVMVGEPGEKPFNTLVLGGAEVVVPLERDADGDPFQDDEVILRSTGGSFELRLCSNDAAMEEDEESGLLMYRFERVPFGVYSVFVVSAGVEVETLRGLVVRREGTFFGDRQLPQEREGQAMAPAPNADDEDEDEGDTDALALSESSAEDEDYIDQDEGDDDDDLAGDEADGNGEDASEDDAETDQGDDDGHA